MKNMNKILLFFTSFFLLASVAYAEKITWKEIVQQAMDNNPSIQLAQLKLDNAKLAYYGSMSGYLPTVSLKGSASQGENEKNFSRSYSYGISANYTIFEGFSNYNDVKQKSADLKSAESAYDRTISDVAYEIATQYINLMHACQSLELQKQIYERRVENKDMISLKYNSGNVDLGSLRRVEADAELSAYDLRKAERNIESISASLLKAIGRTDSVVLETDERLELNERNIEKPDFENLITTIPEYLIASHDLKSAKLASAKEKSQLLPTVSLSGSISRFDSQWTPDKQSWDAGISVSYSLFSGGKRYTDIKSASNKYKIANENFINTENSLRASAISKYNSLTDALENIIAREHYLEASKLQVEISNNKYVNGLATYQDWYSIENDYINSQKTFLDTKKTAALEKAGWYNFIGEGFIQPGK